MTSQCCCFNNTATNTVEPLAPQDDSTQLVEVRANRYLCVHHINTRIRDKQFEKQMRSYIKRHYYSTKYNHVNIPEYRQHVNEQNNKQDCVVKVTASGDYHPNIPQSDDDVISPSNVSTCVHSRETTMSNMQPVVHAIVSASPGPMLFLLHGVGGSARVFKAQIDHFSSQGYEIVAPDLIGHGYSPGSRDKQDYLFEELLVDVFILFDMCCKSENIVIGHSYGACFAAVLARRRPHLVSKLVMISGGAPTPLAPQPGIFSCPQCLLSCLKPVLKRGFNKSAFHKKNDVPERHLAFSVPTHVLKYTMNGQAWPEGDTEFHRWISCPTLLVHGRDDQLITLEEEHEMVETIYGCVLHVIDDASHMVMMEQPHRVNSILQDFVTGTTSRPTTPIDETSQHLDSYRVTDTNKHSDRSERVQSQNKNVSCDKNITAHDNKMASVDQNISGQNGVKLTNSSSNQGANGHVTVTKESVTKESVASGDTSNNRPSLHARQSRVSLKSAKSIPSRLVSANFMHKSS